MKVRTLLLVTSNASYYFYFPLKYHKQAHGPRVPRHNGLHTRSYNWPARVMPHSHFFMKYGRWPCWARARRSCFKARRISCCRFRSRCAISCCSWGAKMRWDGRVGGSLNHHLPLTALPIHLPLSPTHHSLKQLLQFLMLLPWTVLLQLLFHKLHVGKWTEWSVFCKY
jgi:hypothetical protein